MIATNINSLSVLSCPLPSHSLSECHTLNCMCLALSQPFILPLWLHEDQSPACAGLMHPHTWQRCLTSICRTDECLYKRRQPCKQPIKHNVISAIKNLSTKSFGNSEKRAINSAWVGCIPGRGLQACKGMTVSKSREAGSVASSAVCVFAQQQSSEATEGLATNASM